MSDLTRELKQFARERGADLVGIAPAERFADVPPERSPLSIFPEMTAAIVIGRRITRGTLRGLEEGTNLGLYEQFGYSWLDTQFVALSTFEVGEWLEDRGWEAVPLFPFPTEAYPQGIAVSEGAPAPNVCGLRPRRGRRGARGLSYVGIALTPGWPSPALPPSSPTRRWRRPHAEAACVAVPERSVRWGHRPRAGRWLASAARTVARGPQASALPERRAPQSLSPSGAPDRLGAICEDLSADAEDNHKLGTEPAHRFACASPGRWTSRRAYRSEDNCPHRALAVPTRVPQGR